MSNSREKRKEEKLQRTQNKLKPKSKTNKKVCGNALCEHNISMQNHNR